MLECILPFHEGERLANHYGHVTQRLDVAYFQLVIEGIYQSRSARFAENRLRVFSYHKIFDMHTEMPAEQANNFFTMYGDNHTTFILYHTPGMCQGVQYRTPYPVLLHGRAEQYRTPYPVLGPGRAEQYRTPRPVLGPVMAYTITKLFFVKGLDIL